MSTQVSWWSVTSRGDVVEATRAAVRRCETKGGISSSSSSSGWACSDAARRMTTAASHRQSRIYRHLVTDSLLLLHASILKPYFHLQQVQGPILKVSLNNCKNILFIFYVKRTSPRKWRLSCTLWDTYHFWLICYAEYCIVPCRALNIYCVKNLTLEKLSDNFNINICSGPLPVEKNSLFTL